jgi:glutamate dehydrogenase/leucine dehydrogenase
MLSVVERLTGNSVGPEEKRLLTEGPREIDFVRSALAETMEISYQHVRDEWRSRGLADLRLAAMAFAIRRVAGNYLEQGVFP